MSVVGIDFGAQSTKIGVARNKGIDIVRTPRPLPSNIISTIIEGTALTLMLLFFAIDHQ